MMELNGVSPVNLMTVHQKLKDSGKDESVGGVTYIAALPDAAASPGEAEYYLSVLEEKAALRKLISICQQSLSKAFEPGIDSESVIAEAEKGILTVRKQKQDKTPSVGVLVDQALNEIEILMVQRGAVSGIPTGFLDLDRLTDGTHASELIIIAAYPGMGKSTLAMNIAEHVAIDHQLAVGIFSLEMSAKRLVFRMLASRGGVNLRTIKKGEISERDIPKLISTGQSIKKSPFHFCDLSDISVFQLRSKARQMVQSADVKMIVIDYLQLLTAPGRKDQNREQEVSLISRNLKMMACELGLPVIALSQLNDDGKLRESRAIGQDADGIWVLKPKEGEDMENDNVTMKLEIRKQRDGQAPATIDLLFRKTNVRFENVAKISAADVPKQYKD